MELSRYWVKKKTLHYHYTTLHYTTLHYTTTTLHYTTLLAHDYTTLHYTHWESNLKTGMG